MNNANKPLDKIFDKDKILEKEQAAALVGEIGFTLAGDIISKNKWENDDPRSIALHGIIGGIVAEISGGSFGEGLSSAAINKLVIAKLGEMREPLKDKDGNVIKDADGNILTKPVLDGDELRWISAGLGGLIAGNQGAGIADSATKNNGIASALKYSARIIKKGDQIFAINSYGEIIEELLLGDLLDVFGRKEVIWDEDGVMHVQTLETGLIEDAVTWLNNNRDVVENWFMSKGKGAEHRGDPLKGTPPINDFSTNKNGITYEANPAHVKGSGKQDPNKDEEPGDSQEVWNSSIRAHNGKYYGVSKDGKIYRYSVDQGRAHFNGIMRKKDYENIPWQIRKYFEIILK